MEINRVLRRPFLFIALVLVALVGGWAAVWYYGAGRAEAEIQRWMANEKAHDRDITCASMTRAGFPFRLELTCTGFSMASKTPHGIITTTAPRVMAVAQITDPRHIIAEADAPLVIERPGFPPLKLGWTQAQVSALVRTDGFFDEASAQAQGFTLHEGEGQLASAERAELHARPRPNEPTTLDVVSQARGVMLALPFIKAGPADYEFQGGFKGIIRAAQPRVLLTLPGWAQAGGVLDLAFLKLRNEPSLVQANGQLRLTQDGRPDGQLTVQVAGLDHLVEVLGLGKQVNPMALAVVQAFSKPATIDGREARAYPLTFRQGSLVLGPISVPLPSAW